VFDGDVCCDVWVMKCVGYVVYCSVVGLVVVVVMVMLCLVF